MKIRSLFLNFLLSTALFFASFYIAWQLNASVNFLYSSWYEALELGDAIKKYAPKNNYKKNFEDTDKKQHVELFSGIVKAIQNNGEGLQKLSYKDKNNFSYSLLTEAEIIHLQDVANFVSRFKYLGVVGLAIAILIFLFMQFTGVKITKYKRHILGGVGVIFTIIAAVVLIGPTRLFYIGHELIFPDNHQWFFYYEDSLMSTMMKAPALFGPIACQLVLLTVLIWMLALNGLKKIGDKLKMV